MSVRQLTLCGVLLATLGMPTLGRAADTNHGLMTGFRLYVGKPATVTGLNPRVLLLPGTLVMPPGSGADYFTLYRQLENAFRLEDLHEVASQVLSLEPNEDVVVPSAAKELTTTVTLLSYDDTQAAYRVRLEEKGKTHETKLVVKRGKRGTFGGRDGDAAPYFFLIIQPYTAEQEMKDASIQGITPPVLLKRVQPEYPEAARTAKVQGDVVVNLTVAADGSVRDLRVEEGPAELREATVAAVKQWRFEPARDKEGHAVDFPYHVEVGFLPDAGEAPKGS